MMSEDQPKTTQSMSTKKESFTNLKNAAFSFIFYILQKYIWSIYKNKNWNLKKELGIA